MAAGEAVEVILPFGSRLSPYMLTRRLWIVGTPLPRVCERRTKNLVVKRKS